VVVTDYPDSGIMGNVMRNVQANADLADGVDVRPIGYEWGTDVSELLFVFSSARFEMI
jgi:nicotinamide N-methyltransferase